MTTEEPILPVAAETAAIVADLVVAPNPIEPNSVVDVADEESKPNNKKLAAAAVPRKRKSGPRTHPPYFEMIKEAIVTLNERNGSSQFAIAKFIVDNQKNLPANFRKTLLLQSKKLVVSGKLVKVKSSYKLPSKAAVAKAIVVSASSPSKKKKKAAAVKPKTKKVTVSKKEALPKTAAKPTLAASKAKPVVKGKPAARVTTLEASKPAKVQRTSTRSSPGNKPDVVVAKPVVEKVPVKKAVAKKGKK